MARNGNRDKKSGGAPPGVRGAREVLVDISEVPLGSLPTGGYMARHADVRLLTAEQRETITRLREGLNHRAARCANGRFVESNSDALRWLLEKVAAAENRTP